MSSDTKVSSDTTEPKPSSDGTPPSGEQVRGRGSNARRRGGRGSHQRRADSYRLEKNVAFDDARRRAIAERFGVAHTSIDYPAPVSLKIKERATPVSSPQLRLPIVTGRFSVLLRESVDYIRAARIDISQQEYETIEIVSAIQITCKFHASLEIAHLPFDNFDLRWSMFFQSVSKSCNDAFSSTSKFINAIGYFRDNSCTYVPVQAYSEKSHPEKDLPSDDQAGHFYRRLSHFIQTQFSFEVIQQLSILSDEQYQYLWQFLYPLRDQIPLQFAVPQYDEENRRYIRRDCGDIFDRVVEYKTIMERVHRKLTNAVESVALNVGYGSPIQLVGSTQAEFGTTECYSLIKHDTGDFALGALFGFGSKLVDIYPSAFHNPDICPFRQQVAETGWAQDLTRALQSGKIT